MGKRNISQIANELLEYNKSKGKVLKGLVRRRAAERQLFLSGQLAVPQNPKKYVPTKVDIISNTPIGDFTLHWIQY